MIKKIWNKLQDKYSFLCPYYWRDLKYKISCFFRHRNKWVIDAIPREWRDKDAVFEEVLFAGIIHFVEQEEALTSVVWKSNHKKKITEIYNWAKFGRKELMEKINSAYPTNTWSIDDDGKFTFNTCDSKNSYKKLYGEVNRLEKLLYDTDTKHLNWLIKYRNILWV